MKKYDFKPSDLKLEAIIEVLRVTAEGEFIWNENADDMIVKLYDVPRDSRIQLSDGTELNFKRIDGMYSLCLTDDNEPVHLVAWTEVAVIEQEQPR